MVTSLKALNATDTAALRSAYGAAVKNPRLCKKFLATLDEAGGPAAAKLRKQAWGVVQEDAGLRKGAAGRGPMIEVGERATRTELAVGDGRSIHVVVGGGATTKNLSPQQALAMQQFADKTGSKVALVGSRVNGKMTSISDFDYIVDPINSGLRSQAMRELPRGPKVVRQYGQANGIDIIIDTPLDALRPHVVFVPRTGGQ